MPLNWLDICDSCHQMSVHSANCVRFAKWMLARLKEISRPNQFKTISRSRSIRYYCEYYEIVVCFLFFFSISVLAPNLVQMICEIFMCYLIPNERIDWRKPVSNRLITKKNVFKTHISHFKNKFEKKPIKIKNTTKTC